MKKYICLIGLCIMLTLFLVAGCSANTESTGSASMSEVEYKALLKSTANEIVSSAAHAESVLGSYATVWRYSIQNDMNTLTFLEVLGLSTRAASNDAQTFDSIVGSNRVSKGDFSKAVAFTSEYYRQIGTLGDIDKQRSNISNAMNQLNKAPANYEKEYDVLMELYIAYDEYVSLAASPTGSLASFTDKANQLSSTIVSKFKELNVRISD